VDADRVPSKWGRDRPPPRLIPQCLNLWARAGFLIAAARTADEYVFLALSGASDAV
jgi:hypothetical protein